LYTFERRFVAVGEVIDCNDIEPSVK